MCEIEAEWIIGPFVSYIKYPALIPAVTTNDIRGAEARPPVTKVLFRVNLTQLVPGG